MHANRQAEVEEAFGRGGHIAGMQRRRLVCAMGELLGEVGFQNATVGRVAKRAGVSRRTFYEVFDDREECFLAALEQAVERIAMEVVAAYRRPGGWSARLRSALTALLEHFDAHPAAARMCVVETLKGGPMVLEHRRRVLGSVIAAIEEGRAEAAQDYGRLPLTAEGVVGGALAVVHGRLLEDEHGPLTELVSPLTALIVQPYIGPTAARRELRRRVPKTGSAPVRSLKDPFKGLSIRFTYRTARVLATIAEEPGASNRMIAEGAGIHDEGQMSRLLRRLQDAGLTENLGERRRGDANVWWLTARGEAIHATLIGVERAPTQGAVKVPARTPA